jgi:hypothetical protein
MATLVSVTNGNFTSASTWEGVNTPISLLPTTAVTAQTLTTTFVASNGLTSTGGTATGVVLYMANRVAAGATGVFELAIFNSTAGATAATASFLGSDIPVFTAANLRQIYVRLNTPLTLVNGNAYQLRLRFTIANAVSVQVIGANQWARLFTDGVPATGATGDIFYVVGRLTGPGSTASVTVTMDNNNSTQYSSLALGQFGTLQWSTSTNTELRLYGQPYAGALISTWMGGGNFRMGTTSSPIQAGVTASFWIGATTVGGLRVQINDGASFEAAGAYKKPWTLLTSTIAAGATGATVADATGWSVGDDIVIAATTRTITQSDRRSINSISGNFIGFTATSFLHDGVGIYAAEVINLTRNCQISCVNPSFKSYMTHSLATGNTMSLDSVEISDIGYAQNIGAVYWSGNGTASVSLRVTNCAFVECVGAVTFPSTSNLTNFLVDNCVGYRINGASSLVYTPAAATTPTILSGATVSNCVAISGTSSSFAGFAVQNNSIDMIGNRSSGHSSFGILYGVLGSRFSQSGTFNNNLVHANGNGLSVVIYDSLISGKHPTGNAAVRNGSWGWYANFSYNSRFDNTTLIENTTANLLLSYNIGAVASGLIFNNLIAHGSTAYPTGIGIAIGAANNNTTSHTSQAVFNNCLIGTSGSHTAGDIGVVTTVESGLTTSLVFNNCTLSSSVEFIRSSFTSANSSVALQRADGATGTHRIYYRSGLQSTDTTIFRSSSYSLRLTPSSSTGLQKFSPKVIPVRIGSTPTISTWVRMSATADGTNYNGSLPRMFLEYNGALGTFPSYDDILLATAATGNGVWQQLSAVLPVVPTDNTAFKVYLDCSGTLGWVNVDDWKITQ